MCLEVNILTPNLRFFWSYYNFIKVKNEFERFVFIIVLYFLSNNL